MFWLVGQIIPINCEVFGVFFVAFCHRASLVLDFALLFIRVFLRFIKSLLRTNVLNDVTAAPFSVSFSQLPAAKKTPKMVQL